MVSHIHDRTPGDPARDDRVRAVIDALAAPTEPGPLPGEVEAVAAFRAQVRSRRSPMSHLTPVRTAVGAALGAGVLLVTGAGAAAAGALPGAAQQTAHDVLGALGIAVPAGEKAAAQADERKPAEEAVADTGEVEEPDGASAGRGEEVREIANDDSLTGLDKGVAVSGAASEGKSRAGQHGAPQEGTDPAAAGQEQEAPAGGSAPVDTPNDGGTGTADTATGAKADGASSGGTEKAGAASDGRSTVGSGSSARP
jgi:hypothetical protein